jgi:DNA-directed RNA polymerase specialized sigma24 family protein
LILRYYVDLTEAETAETLGVSVGTVKSVTSRSLAKLRRDPAWAGLHWPTGSKSTLRGAS